MGLHPQSIATIAQWHQNEWQHISPHLTTQRRIEQYRAYRNTPSIPSCLLALANNDTAGSASIVESDLETHPQFSPWLASVYVHPNYRCQGIATQLIEQCINNARLAGAQTLYLFTSDQSDFYRKRGWRHIESSLYHGENIDIMAFDLSLAN